MKRYLRLLIPFLIALFVVFLIGLKQKNAQNTSAINSNQETFASLKIETDEKSESFDISDFVGRSALEATEAVVEVETTGTGENAYVTGIMGRAADAQKREFWEFNVNASQAEVGAGTYIVKNHDEIEWKISNY